MNSKTVHSFVTSAIAAAAAILGFAAFAAVKPVAIWNGDLADASARGGFTVSANGNTISDGVVTIDGSTGGVIFATDTSYNTTHMSAVVAFENVSAPSSSAALVVAGSKDSGRYLNQAGIGVTSGLKFKGIWNNGFWNNTAADNSASTYSSDSGRHYLAYYCKHMTSNGNPSNGGTSGGGGGTAVYLDGDTTALYAAQGLRGSGVNYTSYTIGGFNGNGSYQLSNAKIAYVALIAGVDASNTDLQAWALPSMTSAETVADGGSVTGGEAVGVNLTGGSVSLSANTTVAALFVQANTTLTFAEGVKLTVNGPIYVANGCVLTLDMTSAITGSQEVISYGTAGYNAGEIAATGSYQVVDENGVISLTSYSNAATISGDTKWSEISWTDGTWHENTPVTLTLTADAVITMDETVAMPSLAIEGGYAATIVYTKVPTISNGITCDSTSSYSILVDATKTDFDFASAFTVPAGVTYTIAGSTSAATTNEVGGLVTVNGTLNTTGYLYFTNANIVATTGVLNVQDGATKAFFAEKGFSGTLTVDAGATYVNTRAGDAMNWSGSPTINVYGTLDFGRTRWTVGNNFSVNIYSGAAISGYGQDENGVLDTIQNNASTLNFLDNENESTKVVTLSGRMKHRNTCVYNVAEGVTVNAGSSDNTWTQNGWASTALIEKQGAGTLKFVASAEAMPIPVTVTAGTVELAGGNLSGAVTVGESGSFVFTSGSFSGSISGAGAVAVNGGTYMPAMTSFTGSVTVADGATYAVASSVLANFTSVTVADGGTLRIFVTDDEWGNGYTPENVTVADGVNVLYSNSSGTAQVTGEGKTLPAQGIYWVGGETGEWAAASNWSGNAAPTATDVVSITNAATITVTADDVSKAVLVKATATLTGAVGTSKSATSLGLVTISDGVTLTVDTTAATNYIWGVAGGTLVKTGSGALIIVNSTSTSYAVAGTTVQVNEGTLCIHNANQDCYMSDPTFIVGENGTLDNLGYFTVEGTLTIESDYEKTVFKNSDYTVSGVITHARVRGTPALVKNGTGDVTFMMGTQNGSLSAVTVNGGTLNMGSNHDATISGAVTGDGALAVNSTLNISSADCTFSCTGGLSGTNGVIATSGFLPASGWASAMTEEAWKGTTWLSNVSTTEFTPNTYGNANSTVKLSGMQFYFPQGSAVQVLPAIELENGNYEYAMNLNNGFSYDYSKSVFHYVKIPTLKGSGRILGNSSGSNVLLVVADSSEYTGSIELVNKLIWFGAEPGAQENIDNSAGQIVVCTNGVAYLASGATWTATNGLTVKGTLVNNGGTLPASVTFADGATLDFGTAVTSLSVANKTLTLGSTLTVVGDGLKNGSAIFTGLSAEPSTLPRVTVGDTTYRTVYSDGSVLLKFIGFSISIQ